jgi:tetratricopeptide (TPR) repeat protein
MLNAKHIALSPFRFFITFNMSMQKNIAKTFITALALIILIIPSHAIATEFTMGKEIDSAWKKGSELMYRLEFKKAEKIFEKLSKDYPEHPAGPLALSALRWWQLSQNYDIPSSAHDARIEFISFAEETIKRSEHYMNKTHDEALAYFTMGTAYGLLGRWYAIERSWFKAYKNGKKGKKYLSKALEINPELYDAYLGLGIFDYYCDTLPGVLKFFATLLFIKGDRERGLEEIDLAMKNGKFFTTEASIFKASILIQFEKDFRSATRIIDKLRKSEPGNVFFKLIEVVTLLNTANWQETIDKATKLLSEVKNDKGPIDQQKALLYLAIGDSHIMLRNYTTAIEYLTKGIRETDYPNKGWVTFCYLRRGQAYDLFREREKALKNYKIVMGREDFWKALEQAEHGLKEPYDFEEVSIQMNDLQ